MFQRQGGQFCQVHPDVQLQISQTTVKSKRGWKLERVETCSACDKLVEELRSTKVTDERFKK